MNKHSSNQDIQFGQGYQTLQGNIDYYRHDILKNSNRRNLNQGRMPQKLWPNGRPRGSLEKFSVPQEVRVHRATRTLRGDPRKVDPEAKPDLHHDDVNKSLEQPYAQQPKEQAKSMSSEQIVKAIEKLSKRFGVPFTMKGHKEQFVNYVNNSKELRETLTKYTKKPQSLHYNSVPPTAPVDGVRMKVPLSYPFHNMSVKDSAEGIVNSKLFSSVEPLPVRKHLFAYM
eukprot:CAMPEP_0168349674 /NCGR_PEP_ID=MMETSP0213-20121227/20579_1 /TAXON_ID=151035 /ORGANISM="Euplotes harpa, Strain FSP1.4" /LENGTH=226 /DNA_ID=CAMNT_0008359705 /DNA_START=268 /DNA_END=949 /DNA_ORIENTATION=-